MFTLKFDTNNAAFQDGDCLHEVARILGEVKNNVKFFETCGIIRDINGNRIGEWKLNEESE